MASETGARGLRFTVCTHARLPWHPSYCRSRKMEDAPAASEETRDGFSRTKASKKTEGRQGSTFQTNKRPMRNTNDKPVPTTNDSQPSSDHPSRPRKPSYYAHRLITVKSSPRWQLNISPRKRHTSPPISRGAILILPGILRGRHERSPGKVASPRQLFFRGRGYVIGGARRHLERAGGARRRRKSPGDSFIAAVHVRGVFRATEKSTCSRLLRGNRFVVSKPSKTHQAI